MEDLNDFDFWFGDNFDIQILEELEKCLKRCGLNYYNTVGDTQGKIHYKKNFF